MVNIRAAGDFKEFANASRGKLNKHLNSTNIRAELENIQRHLMVCKNNRSSYQMTSQCQFFNRSPRVIFPAITTETQLKTTKPYNFWDTQPRSTFSQFQLGGFYSVESHSTHKSSNSRRTWWDASHTGHSELLCSCCDSMQKSWSWPWVILDPLRCCLSLTPSCWLLEGVFLLREVLLMQWQSDKKIIGHF